MGAIIACAARLQPIHDSARIVGQPELIKRPKSSWQVNFLFARHPPTPAVPLPPTKPGECRTLGDFSMPHPYLGLKSAQKEHT